MVRIPFPSISIGGNTEDGRAHRSKHEHQGDTPSDICVRLSERLREVGNSQGHSEEIKGVPRPGKEGDEEEHPLLCV